MFAKSKKNVINIPVALDEQLTSDSCVKLIIELMKYILYQKQQIPFPCDSLTQLRTKVKSHDRNCSSITTLLNTLNDISKHLSAQFSLEGCNVKEVMIIVGATIMSPKLYIIVELPLNILNGKNHLEYKHSSRKPLLNLMRSMMESTEFQEAMTLPLNPTNTFVMLQKSDSNVVSDFFLLKPQYTVPNQVISCFRIKLNQSEDYRTDCNCTDLVKIYHDIHSDQNCDTEFRQQKQDIVQPTYQWYQSKEVIKGFKFLR